MKKQSHFTLVLIAVLFTGLIVSCEKDSDNVNNNSNNNSNNNNTTDNYPWMKVGNEWRYDSYNVMLTDTHTDAAIKLIVRQLSSNSFVFRMYNSVSNDSGVYVVSNDTLYVQSYNYGVLSAKQKLYYIGMHTGDQWITNNGSYTCTQTVLSVNDVVTTPLGTFTCYRVSSQALGVTGHNETYYDVENHVGEIKGNTYLSSGTDSLVQSVFLRQKNF